MADVARLAGVSGQTVSRVANGRQNVDAATRARVQDAMRQLGYREADGTWYPRAKVDEAALRTALADVAQLPEVKAA